MFVSGDLSQMNIFSVRVCDRLYSVVAAFYDEFDVASSQAAQSLEMNVSIVDVKITDGDAYFKRINRRRRTRCAHAALFILFLLCTHFGSIRRFCQELWEERCRVCVEGMVLMKWRRQNANAEMNTTPDPVMMLVPI
jgi:hypothetical protein